jgi:hypothetical protein
MAKSYVKACDYCKQQIQMSDKSGNWLPYNLNNGQHDCRTNGKEKKQEVTLQTVQKKLQDIGITINLEKLMSKWPMNKHTANHAGSGLMDLMHVMSVEWFKNESQSQSQRQEDSDSSG